MLESLLKDGEDAYLNLPYSTIREAVVHAGSFLEDVTVARLVIIGFGDSQDVLIEDTSNGTHITGLLGFKRPIWGDSEFRYWGKRPYRKHCQDKSLF